MSDWKEPLYRSYVSSGQARGEGAISAAQHFAPRRKFTESLIRRHFPRDRNAAILDIGCGHGGLLYFLERSGYRRATGIDTSAEQVALAHSLGILNAQCGDGMQYLRDTAAASLDVVCLMDILEHLTREQLFDMLREVRRVLAPSGVSIGHVPNAQGIFSMGIRYGDLTHEMAFTESSLSQACRIAGFADVDCFEDKPPLRGAVSVTRRVLWEAGSFPLRILFAAETGEFRSVLSRNLTFVARV